MKLHLEVHLTSIFRGWNKDDVIEFVPQVLPMTLWLCAQLMYLQNKSLLTSVVFEHVVFLIPLQQT